MTKETFAAIVAAGVTIIASSAMADSAKGDPIYFGARSTNPEQETFGYPAGPANPRQLIFIGPARNIGRITGDLEKDSIAYRLVLRTRSLDGWSGCPDRE